VTPGQTPPEATTPAATFGAVVWVRAQARLGDGTASAWSAWQSLTLPGATGGASGLQTPMIAYSVFTNGDINAEVLPASGYASVKLAAGTIDGPVPDDATVLAAGADSSDPYEFPAAVTLAPDETAWLGAFAFDAAGNRSAKGIVRAFRSATGTGEVPTPPSVDITDLVDDLGGDAVVSAFYDIRVNITTSPPDAFSALDFLDTWDDARGPVGYGPQLAPFSGGQVGYDPLNPAAVAPRASSLMEMQTARDALFSLAGDKTLIVGGWAGAGNGWEALASIASRNMGEAATANSYLLISKAGNPYRALADDDAGTGQVLADSLVTRVPGTFHLIVATKAAANTKCEVPNQPAGTAAARTSGSATKRLSLFMVAQGNDTTGRVKFVIVLDRAATSGDIALIQAWAVANHGTTNA